MLNLKVLMFALLLLAADVLAVRCTYSVTHSDVAAGKPGQRNSKLAEMDQDQADSVVENMGTWSNGKYSAKKARLPNMITVSGTTTSSQSNAMIQDMQHIVQTHYKARSKSPSPGPAGHSGSGRTSPHHRRWVRMIEMPYDTYWE